MSERNLPRYVVSLPALFVTAFLAGFFAPIPEKMDLWRTQGFP